MNDALRRAIAAAGYNPDAVAEEARNLNLALPEPPPTEPREPLPAKTMDEQLGLDGVNESQGIITIRPGTKRHLALERYRGDVLETSEAEFLGDFREAGLVQGGFQNGWTTSPRGDMALGMLDYGSIAKCEKGKPITSQSVRTGQPAGESDDVRATREQAIALSDRPPSEAWKEHAAQVIAATARQLEYLTSEDVWNHGLRQPDNGSPDGDALGPAMRRARVAGIIEPTDRTATATDRPQRHNNPKRVWRSLVYEP